MMRLLAAATMLAMLAACGAETEAPTATEEAAAEPTTAAAAEPAPAAAPAALAAGAVVEVAVQTQCHEVGPGADDIPWDVYPGVTKTVIAVEGDQIRVKVADVECLMPAKAVKLSGS